MEIPFHIERNVDFYVFFWSRFWLDSSTLREILYANDFWSIHTHVCMDAYENIFPVLIQSKWCQAPN